MINGTTSSGQRTGDNINAIHDRALDRIWAITGGSLSFVVQMFGDTSTTGSV